MRDGASNSMELNRRISISPTKRLISDQFLMVLGYRRPIQQYLGMTLDAKLRWKAHINKKQEEQTTKNKLRGP
jgi:hypothetical protein